jgi:hypothetical protein
VIKVTLGIPVQLAHKDPKALLDLLVLLDHKDHRDHKE